MLLRVERGRSQSLPELPSRFASIELLRCEVLPEQAPLLLPRPAPTLDRARFSKLHRPANGSKRFNAPGCRLHEPTGNSLILEPLRHRRALLLEVRINAIQSTLKSGLFERCALPREVTIRPSEILAGIGVELLALARVNAGPGLLPELLAGADALPAVGHLTRP